MRHQHRRPWGMVLGVGWCLVVSGQMWTLSVAAEPIRAHRLETASARNAEEDVRDTVLMLDGGPLHLRFHLRLNGRSLSTVREKLIDRLIAKLDQNGDGKLTRAEAGRSPLFRRVIRPEARNFLASLGGQRAITRHQLRQTVERLGGLTVVYRQDRSSSRTDQEVFSLLDRNGSGVIEPDEMAAASARIRARDTDHDQCVSFREFVPKPKQPPTSAFLVSAVPNQASGPVEGFSDVLRDTRERLLPRRLLSKYDTDGDGRLSAGELHWTSRRLRTLDRNRDAVLDNIELSRIAGSPCDLELAVELSGSSAGQPALRVLQCSGRQETSAARTDLTRVVLPGSVLTVSFRKVNPMAATVENAMQVFNRLDGDANGYLEQKETTGQIRFERGLFTQIDADGDGRIFGDEMKRYVTARGEPAARSCRVNIYDLGHGFFQTLDRNSDGRISERELRMVKTSLRSLKRNRQPGLSREEPVRHFHIEFVRSSYLLFGPAGQMVAMAPRFQDRELIGPIWFQRMDRNNDGDLTWLEFLGPRDVFQRLDADHDGLIDPEESRSASQE